MKNELLVEIVKTDLKNSIESGLLNEQNKLMAINDSLRMLSVLDDPAVNAVIVKYREKQKEQEEILIKAQTSIMENADNIYKHLQAEL